MFKNIPYLFSQYIWIFILAFFACIPFYLPYKNEGTLKSLDKYEKFNKSQIPVIFTHISDVHIDHINTNTSYYYLKALSIITDKIKPEFNVITGDLANNFPGSKILLYGRQQGEDINLYTNYSSAFKKKFPVFEVDGNHDVFGIYDYDTKKNQSDFYKQKNFDEYQISVFSYLINNRNYTFIGLSPFDFPSPHPPLLYNARPPNDFYEKLKKTFEKIKKEYDNDHLEIVVFNHFPYYHWKFGSKTFRNILKENEICLFLNGHLHPSEPLTMHHDGFLEIVGCDLLEHQKFSVAAVDNGRISYHTIDLKEVNDDSVFAFVTNPIPDRLLSNHQIFNEKDTFVRVIVYSNEDKKPVLNASVSDDVLNNKELECSKTYHNNSFRFWLCQTELNIVKEGTYSLKINGTTEQTFNFTITNGEKSYKEKIYEPTSSFIVQYQVHLAILWFFLLIIMCPLIKVPQQFQSKFDMWINDQSNESMWIYSIFFGFLAVKSRIERLPNLIRYSLFIVTLWPFCLPTIFVTIDHHFGFVWTWGFVCNHQYFDYWGQMFTLMYFAAFLLPIVILFSALSLSFTFRWSLLVEIAINMVAFASDVYILLKWCNESAGNIGAAFSLFSLTLIYFYSLLFIWRFCWKKELKDVGLLSTAALLENESIEK